MKIKYNPKYHLFVLIGLTALSRLSQANVLSEFLDRISSQILKGETRLERMNERVYAQLKQEILSGKKMGVDLPVGRLAILDNATSPKNILVLSGSVTGAPAMVLRIPKTLENLGPSKIRLVSNWDNPKITLRIGSDDIYSYQEWDLSGELLNARLISEGTDFHSLRTMGENRIPLLKIGNISASGPGPQFAAESRLIPLPKDTILTSFDFGGDHKLKLYLKEKNGSLSTQEVDLSPTSQFQNAFDRRNWATPEPNHEKQTQ